MREFAVVLIVVLVLFALTAIKYRRQISMMIGIGRAIRQAKINVGSPNAVSGRTEPVAADLAKCDSCGVFVPRSRMIAKRGKDYCSKECLATVA